MGVIEEIFAIQLAKDVFNTAKVDFTKGLAQLAIDKGYSSLSPKQKAVLESYLSVSCSGIIDPGGHHHNCEVLLQKEDLLEAYQFSEDNESLMCAGCRSDQSYYEYQWQRISDE